MTERVRGREGITEIAFAPTCGASSRCLFNVVVAGQLLSVSAFSPLQPSGVPRLAIHARTQA